MRRFLVAFPLLWPPRKKRTAEADEAMDQGLVIPTHLPEIPDLLQLQRKNNFTLLCPPKDKADRTRKGLVIPTHLLQTRTAKLNNHKHKLRFVHIAALVFKSKSCSVKVTFIS